MESNKNRGKKTEIMRIKKQSNMYKNELKVKV